MLGEHREIIELILELGAKNYNWTMCHATQGVQIETVEFMLEQGAKNYDCDRSYAAKRVTHRDNRIINILQK